MKTTVIIGLFILAAIRSPGQGELNFANLAPGVNAPVTNAAGLRIIGPGPYVADLFWSSNTGAQQESLISAGFVVAFSSLTNNGGGYFIGGTRTLPVSGGLTILVQVRVWNTLFGADYARARESGGEFGYSNMFLLPMNTPPGAPTPLNGLEGFQLQIIPEPSGVALGMIGLSLALLSRRQACSGPGHNFGRGSP